MYLAWISPLKHHERERDKGSAKPYALGELGLEPVEAQEEDNTGALRLYERLGFVPTHRTVEATSDDDEVPAIELVKHLFDDELS